MTSCLRHLRREALPRRRPEIAARGAASRRPSLLILAATAGSVFAVLVARALIALIAGA